MDRTPRLIDIYGGAWQRGAPGDCRQFDSYLAHKGYAVFAIDYRHAPAFRFPAQIEDVRAAISFVHANAAQYRTDPNRLILCGRSAGGQLALLAAYEPGPGADSRGDRLLRARPIWPRAMHDLPSPDPIDVRQVLATYLGGSPAQAPDGVSRRLAGHLRAAPTAAHATHSGSARSYREAALPQGTPA